jgi:hypothetical protein
MTLSEERWVDGTITYAGRIRPAKKYYFAAQSGHEIPTYVEWQRLDGSWRDAGPTTESTFQPGTERVLK